MVLGAASKLCTRKHPRQLHLARALMEQKEKWLELAWRLSADEKLLGMSQHFLYIGRKPEA